MGIGDWGLGLGIGDWAQSPIPNPQSPIPKILFFKNYINLFLLVKFSLLIIYLKYGHNIKLYKTNISKK